LDLDPDHGYALSKLAEAGSQGRLKALYQAASRDMEYQRWQDAIDELTEILEIEPDYKDSVKLLVQTRNAIEKQNVNLELSELYDKAIAHFEAEEYDQAEQLFGQIRKISPLYRRADALWAESRRRKAKEGGFARLNQNLAHTQAGNRSGRSLMKRPQVHWLAATGLVVLGIIVTIWLVSLSNRPGDSDLSAEELYTQAQAAFENGERAQARQLVEQALAVDDAYEPAVELEGQLIQLDTLEGRFNEAENAINEANWTQAIETLKALHDNQPEFQTEQVSTALCDAYLARGQERMNSINNPRDQATVRAALTDFRAGELTCSSRTDLNQALTFATDYLEAIAGGGTADAVVEALSTVVEAEPDYAGGQAVQNLYLAYLNRGDAAREQGDRAAAASDYEAAAALSVADVSEAQARLNQLPAVIVDGTETPVAETPAAEEAITPTADTSTPGDEIFTYRAPALVSPDPYAEYAGQFAEITLIWQPLDLEPNTYYDVTIRYFVGNEPRYWGGPVTTNSWRVPVEAGFGQAGQDLFAWWVTVRETGTDKQLSPPSEERYFYWRPG
jgi:outer membrane protein assembly factor BamD (BamD/ComL family)